MRRLILSALLLAACGGRSALLVDDGGRTDRPALGRDVSRGRDTARPADDVRPPWIDVEPARDGSPWKKDSGPKRGHCKASCATASQCGPGMKACINGECAQCLADADCDTSLFKGGCNTVTRTCRMCKADVDCSYPTYKGCDTATGICRMCAADSHCMVAGVKLMTGKCDVGMGICWGCATHADCAFTGSSMKRCHPALKRCVPCLADADCSPMPSQTGFCDAASNVCAGCTTNLQCEKAFGGVLPLTWSCVP
jgi:hypothetical protein